jgi:hypothetical protein
MGTSMPDAERPLIAQTGPTADTPERALVTISASE